MSKEMPRTAKRFIYWAVGIIFAGLLAYTGKEFIPKAISAMVKEQAESVAVESHDEIMEKLNTIETSIQSNQEKDQEVHGQLNTRVGILEEKATKFKEVNREMDNMHEDIREMRSDIRDIHKALLD